MNLNRLSVGISLLSALSGTCLAATPSSQGVIHFIGSIVEPGCTFNAGTSSTFELNGCATPARGSTVSARSVEPVHTVTALGRSAVNVRLIAESGAGARYSDQQYQLVDSAGKPIRSGNYVVTLTSP